MRVNREELIRCLEAVAPGLAKKESVEQSSCYVFRGGRVVTFNDEVAASTLSPIGFDGAVAAEPLRALLGRLPEEEIEVEASNGSMRIRGKRRRAQIAMEAEISLPIDSVDQPADEDWRQLPAEFGEAVQAAAAAAGRDASQFVLTCIHVGPDFVEACDNFQLVRYPLETGFGRDILVRATSLRHVASLDVTEVAETDNWIHFRNPAGLTLSCRLYLDDYPALDEFLSVEGERLALPGGLAEAVARAEIFSSESVEGANVLVEMQAGRLKIRGQGAHGWFEELKQIAYEGPSIQFAIAPKLLAQLTERGNECQIEPGKLRVDSGRFAYVTSLGEVGA